MIVNMDKYVGSYLRPTVLSALRSALDEAGEKLTEKSRDEHRWRHRTGNLGRSLSWVITGDGKGAVTQKSGRATYGVYVYYGTRSHVISAKPGKVLSWVQFGKRNFAKRVTIPARDGEHWIEDIWRRSGAALITSAVDKAMVDKGLS